MIDSREELYTHTAEVDGKLMIDVLMIKVTKITCRFKHLRLQGNEWHYLYLMPFLFDKSKNTRKEASALLTEFDQRPLWSHLSVCKALELCFFILPYCCDR